MQSSLIYLLTSHPFGHQERQIMIDEADAHGHSNPVLVEHPQASSITDKSLLITLFYCSMYHRDAPESDPGSLTALRKSRGIPERQELWIVIRGWAKVNHLPLPSDLDSWMGNKVRRDFKGCGLWITGCLSPWQNMNGLICIIWALSTLVVFVCMMKCVKWNVSFFCIVYDCDND